MEEVPRPKPVYPCGMTMRTHTIRLRPGQDLKSELDGLAEREGWDAACILSCAGSLEGAAVRFAGRERAEILCGPFEIVGFGGTLSRHGSHLPIALSGADGTTLGGHLKEGSPVGTTAEVVIGILPGLKFSRAPDSETGFDELEVGPA